MKKVLMLICFFGLMPGMKAQEGDSTGYPVPDIIAPGEIGEVDEEKGDENYFLDQQYRDELLPPDRREVPDAELEEMKRSREMWYLDAEPRKNETDSTAARRGNYVPLGQRTWFKTLMWFLIIAGFAAFLMIYLNSNRVGLFRRRVTDHSDTEGEQMPEDIFAINYQREIDRAVSRKDYRLATRLMYLQLLKAMADRGIIQYAAEKTNLDYLLQLHPTAYYPAFAKVTRDYEYTWYGKFALDEQGFSIIKNDFNRLEGKLG